MSNGYVSIWVLVLSKIAPSLQNLLKKPSDYPRQPRIFSYATYLITCCIPLSLMGSLALTGCLLDYLSGGTGLSSVIMVIMILLLPISCLFYGIYRRFGVDEEKAWSKFGRLFYKEVRFEEITELKLGLDKYKLYTNKTMINICYRRFDYTLVFIRMLEELSKRRFNLPEAKTTDPNWEEICQRRKKLPDTKNT